VESGSEIAEVPSPADPVITALDIVYQEMIARESAQSSQLKTLSDKSAFLFSTGLAAVAAAAAVVGFLTEGPYSFWTYVWPTMISAASLGFLLVSFVFSYRTRRFHGSPDAEALWNYRTRLPEDAKTNITDGRRYSIGMNDQILEDQGEWVNREMYALIILVLSLVALVLTAAINS